MERPSICSRFRPTIMDGYVVEFATSFRDHEGIFGMSSEPQGPFNVSSSRNAVVVHRADLASEESFVAFSEALAHARSVREYLQRYNELPERIRTEHNHAAEAWKLARSTDVKGRDPVETLSGDGL